VCEINTSYTVHSSNPL